MCNCSGVTQIKDLERCYIALIRQIEDLDKGVKKVHHKSDAPKNAWLSFVTTQTFLTQIKYAEIEHAFLPK